MFLQALDILYQLELIIFSRISLLGFLEANQIGNPSYIFPRRNKKFSEHGKSTTAVDNKFNDDEYYYDDGVIETSAATQVGEKI